MNSRSGRFFGVGFMIQDMARRRAESAADEADLEENALGHLGVEVHRRKCVWA